VTAQELLDALRAWAEGSPADTAAIELLAEACDGHWIEEAARGQLRRWFPTSEDPTTSGIGGTAAVADWPSLARALARRRISALPTELVVLRFAVVIGHGGLTPENTPAVVRALCAAAGLPPPSPPT
jgi:hypothetical protein